MQLGNLLSADDGEPVIGREVEFHILKRARDGQPQRKRIKGLLLPVSEKERQESKRRAVEYLRQAADSPYRDQEGAFSPIPSGVLIEEEAYSFLVQALHDPEDPRVKLVAVKDYPLFRAGIVVSQVVWLTDEYGDYISQEYPETLSADDKRKLEEQAEKNS